MSTFSKAAIFEIYLFNLGSWQSTEIERFQDVKQCVLWIRQLSQKIAKSYRIPHIEFNRRGVTEEEHSHKGQ